MDPRQYTVEKLLPKTDETQLTLATE